jgi:hypothetical protein
VTTHKAANTQVTKRFIDISPLNGFAERTLGPFAACWQAARSRVSRER